MVAATLYAVADDLHAVRAGGPVHHRHTREIVRAPVEDRPDARQEARLAARRQRRDDTAQLELF
jgi:hypothetical protein